LTTDAGNWTTAGPLRQPTSFTYQWYTSPSANGPGAGVGTRTPIAGATNPTITATDIGAHYSVIVTATNVHGSFSYSSASIGPIITSAPSVNTGPVIAGSGQVGQILASNAGGWATAGALRQPTSYSYQWYRSTTANSAGAGVGIRTPIAGATASTFTPTTAGEHYSVIVTATNAHGSFSYSSASVLASSVGATNTVLPTIGQPSASATRIGETAIAQVGTWTGGARTFTYGWYTCQNGRFVATTDDPTLVVPATVSGACLRVYVTGYNSSGGSEVISTQTNNPISAVGGPINTALPTIGQQTSTLTRYGETIIAQVGTWTDASTFTYGWYTCVNGRFIATTDDPVLVVPTSVSGACVRVYVRAYNTASSTEVISTQTGNTIGSGNPSNSTAPSIQGTVKVGNVVSANVGSWGSSPGSYTIAWQNGSTGVELGTGPTYKPTTSGILLRVRVTATNLYGSTAASSANVTVAP
jgi:hypothetical protein